MDANDIDEAVGELDRRIAVLSRLKEALLEAKPIMEDGRRVPGIELCGCGRPATHMGRCKARRSKEQMGHRRAAMASAIVRAHESVPALESGNGEDARGKTEMTDLGEALEKAVGRHESEAELGDAQVERTAGERRRMAEEISRRQQTARESHDAIKSFKEKAQTGICPGCQGPKGRSPYRVCGKCMGSETSKAMAS